MPVANSDTPIPMLAELVAGRVPPLEPLTIDQVEQMMRHGILPDGAPIELIDGLLVRKDRSARGEDPMTHNPAHATCISRLLRVLAIVQAHGCHLRCQLPIALAPTRAPEPDVAIIRGVAEDYSDRHPGPNDAAVVIEVADSSLDFDRSTKLKLYAGAGIPVYWIVNLIDNVVEAYERPNLAERRYEAHFDYVPSDSFELSLRPNISIPIRVNEIIG